MALKDLLASSDVVSLHTPLTDQTTRMIDASGPRRMHEAGRHPD